MSAILAIWNRDGRPIDPAIIDTMLTASSHRAVDGQNVYIDGCVALAHQHFWLTPEEQGEVQPIIDKDASLVMTCDARLDDRDTLQKKLAINKSQKLSDAQLILRAF
ncbi:MAG TPA: hypothetical protein VLA51_08010, partial [Paracoccaceae bacterium]|nr:hypothetical protein [Paracoccaceae bacterium]